MRGELHHTFSAHAALQFTNDTINDFRWFLLKADVEGLARLTTNQTHRRSIYYRARVSSGEGREGSSPGRTQNTSRPTESLIFLLVQKSLIFHLWYSCRNLWYSCWFKISDIPAGSASSIFRGALWTRAWTNVAGISRFGGEVAQHSGLHEVHNCALCREVSHRALFTKIPSLSLVFEIAHFRSLPKTHDYRWGSEQRSV